MLYLYDTIHKNEQEFQSLQQILYWWKRQFGHNPLYMFRELNITGLDTKSVRSLDYRNTASDIQELRRYQILDHLRRPIDIRTCPCSIWCENTKSIEKKPKPITEKMSGRKRPVRKYNEPSMRKRMLIANQMDENTYAASHYIVKDKSRIRRKTMITAYDCKIHKANQQLRHWQNTWTWKTRSKSRQQYARHER